MNPVIGKEPEAIVGGPAWPLASGVPLEPRLTRMPGFEDSADDLAARDFPVIQEDA